MGACLECFCQYFIQSKYSKKNNYKDEKDIKGKVMNLYIGSDFHIDFWGKYAIKNPLGYLKIDPGLYDAFILPGDIAEVRNKDIYESFIQEFAYTKKPVFIVVGNHEFYNSSYPDAIFKLKSYFKESRNIHILENEFVDIQQYQVRIWGATLWTDFNRANPVVMREALRFMSDYRLSKGLTPELVLKEHYKSLKSLKEAYLTKPGNYKFVAITHHAPSMKSCDIYHSISNTWYDISDYFFSTNLTGYLTKNKIFPDIWAHGHVHAACNYNMLDGKTKVICNPHGYPLEDNTGFHAEVITFDSDC